MAQGSRLGAVPDYTTLLASDVSVIPITSDFARRQFLLSIGGMRARIGDRYRKLNPPSRQLLRLMAYLVGVALQHYEGACR